MASRPVVVIYGHDRQLLKTRQMILEGSEFRTRTVETLSELKGILEKEQIQLLVLCHSLHLDECEPAVLLARSYSPKVKSLLLVASVPTMDVSKVQADGVVETSGGPQLLVRTVKKLIEGTDAAQ